MCSGGVLPQIPVMSTSCWVIIIHIIAFIRQVVVILGWHTFLSVEGRFLLEKFIKLLTVMGGKFNLFAKFRELADFFSSIGLSDKKLLFKSIDGIQLQTIWNNKTNYKFSYFFFSVSFLKQSSSVFLSRSCFSLWLILAILYWHGLTKSLLSGAN